MKIDNTLVDKIAKLAKLKFDEKSKEKMKKDLVKMIDFIDVLNKIDTDKIDPLIYLSEEKNIMREDDFEENLSQKESLKNAPEKDSDYFKVPKILKK